MKCVKDSDLVIAIGTRLNPFGTTPQYNMPYWDSSKPLVQIEIDQHMIGVRATLLVCMEMALKQ